MNKHKKSLATKNKERNLEDVDASIKQIKQKNKKRRNPLLSALLLLFFPFTAIAIVFKYIFSTQKVRLTTKTTVIFTVIFGFLIASYITIVLLLFNNFLSGKGIDYGEFMATMLLISVVLGLGFIFIGSAAGAIISNAMLKPIRKIITELGGIDGENLSQRLKPIDSQDEIMELVEQVNAMLSSLEESFERQSNFVSDASHELKTPLSVVSGYSDLLIRWGKDDSAVLDEGIVAIKRESLYMSKIIDQMLLLARLGKLNMHKQPLDISKTVKDIVDSYAVISGEHKFCTFFSKEILCDCDKTLLTEAVRAIIDNAIKYTPKEGLITVDVIEGGEDDEYTVKITVEDTGVGIDETDLPHIFDRFYRCDKTRGREKGSAGLGLTICKNIIEMMGGEIFASSVKGEGTRFTILL